MAPLLEVRSLSVTVGGARLVGPVDLELAAGEVHALVGESGSGKTSLARALVGLAPGEAEVGGTVRLGGERPRPGQLVWVPQDAPGALNPVRSVGSQLAEALSVHRGLRGPAREREAIGLLEAVGLEEGAALLPAFAHQLSGGTCQRVLLAAALAGAPRVLIADEPTSALDPPARAVVLGLLRRLARERSLGVLLITHELEALEGSCDQLSVLLAGLVVEQGPASSLLARPRHPYARALLAARAEAGLRPLERRAPSTGEETGGCAFRPRCGRASAACASAPPLVGGVACCHPEEA